MKNKLLIYSSFDLYSFLFSILVAMWFGNAFAPNLFVFITLFVICTTGLYFYWFRRVEEVFFPWKRMAVHTVILLTTIPLLIAVSASISYWFNNIIFWLVITPLFVFASSFMLHRLYKISPGSKVIDRQPIKN